MPATSDQPILVGQCKTLLSCPKSLQAPEHANCNVSCDRQTLVLLKMLHCRLHCRLLCFVVLSLNTSDAADTEMVDGDAGGDSVQPEKMKISDLKTWLDDRGFQEQIVALNQKQPKAKKEDWVALVRQLM